jgi:ketosteroid isomerase-like protein
VSDGDALRAAMLSWNDGGFDAFLRHLAPDVIWHAPPEYLEGDVWRGRDAFERDWRAQFETVFSEVRSEVTELVEAPQGWYVATHTIARAGESGMELEWDSFWLAHLADDLVKEIWVFQERGQARRAAGLERE